MKACGILTQVSDKLEKLAQWAREDDPEEGTFEATWACKVMQS